MSAITIKRAYGKQWFFRNWKEVFQMRYNLDSEEFILFDSESNFFYRVHKTKETSGLYAEDYKKVRLGFVLDKPTEKFDSRIPYKDVHNAYQLPHVLSDKHQAYTIGNYVRDMDSEKMDVITINDSEGWQYYIKTANTTGTVKEDWFKKPFYLYPLPKIKTAKISAGAAYQKNHDYDWDLPNGNTIFSVRGENFITDTTDRLIPYGWKTGELPGIVLFKEEGYGFEMDQASVSVNTVTHSVGAQGHEYQITTMDSDAFAFIVDSNKVDYHKQFSVNYISDMTDSEVMFEPERRISLPQINYVPTQTNGTSPQLINTFTTWDGTEEPWKVFNDSDDDGFKAGLGVQSGILGWREVASSETRYKLEKVVIANTIAVPFENTPYDFDIDGYIQNIDEWRNIKQIRGMTRPADNLYTFFIDSEFSFDGFRINFFNCHPDFDPTINALEVKRIEFHTAPQQRIVDSEYVFWFSTDKSSDYQIVLDKEYEVRGVVVGAGGSGGGGALGGGGSGGETIVINRLLLPSGTYSLHIGEGGDGGPVNLNANNSFTRISDPTTINGEDGEPSYLYDVTNSRIIVEAAGGIKGGNAWLSVSPVVTHDAPATAGGTGGAVDNINYTLDFARHQGASGGRGQGMDGDFSAQNGGDGISVKELSHVDDSTLLEQFVVFGSGGAGGSSPQIGNNAQRSGGANAGDASFDSDIAAGHLGYGGGGAGIYANFATNQYLRKGGKGGAGYIGLRFRKTVTQ